MTKEEIINRIQYLCEERNVSLYQLSKDKDSDIPLSTLTNMLTRGSIPNILTLDRICKALGVTLSQFFIGINEENSFKDMDIIIQMYLMLPNEKKDLARLFLETLNSVK